MTGLTTVVASVNIATQSVIAAQDANGDIAFGQVLVDQNGALFGVADNPLFVSDGVSGDAVNAVATQTAATAAALGTPSDAAWEGTGSGSVVAALKAIWTALTTAIITKPNPVAYSALTGNLTLAAANTAQALQNAGPAATLTICNPASAAQQGIATAESIFVNMVGTASIGAGSNDIEVLPGSTYVVGPTAGAVSWIAATAGHRISGHAAA